MKALIIATLLAVVGVSIQGCADDGPAGYKMGPELPPPPIDDLVAGGSASLIGSRDDALALCKLDSPENAQAESVISDPTSTCIIQSGGHVMNCSHGPGTTQCVARDNATPHCFCQPR